MERKIMIGPERIDATLQPLRDYLEEVVANGAPGDSKVRIETIPDGSTLMVSLEYLEQVVQNPGASEAHAHP